MSINNFGFKPIKIKPISFGPPFGLKKSSESRKTLGKPLRDQVWLKYMGNKAQGKCYCCRIRMIHVTDFQVGHNKAVAKGGKNNISNLRPICGPCNRGMGTKSVENYRKTYFATGGKKKSTKKGIKRGLRKSNYLFAIKPIKLPKFRI